MSKEIIFKIHEIVSSNTLKGYDANFCEKFRDDAVYVGKHEGVIENKIEESITDVIELLDNHSRYLHSLIKGTLLNYFMGFIHPFFDGNGRTARTLFDFVAMKNDLKFVELLSLSSNLKESGKKYQRSFKKVVENNLDLTYFIDYCLDYLIDSIEKVNSKLVGLLRIKSLQLSFDLSDEQIHFREVCT